MTQEALQSSSLTELIPQLGLSLVEQGVAILVAPPGSGKTTHVPLALLEQDWLRGQRILMLEPRRLAARSAATFMARTLGEEVGGRIGYAVRLDRRVSAATRLEVVTEGLLTKRLQADPELAGVGLVIFDEIHERSLHADLALSLCQDVRRSIRPDLRLLAMSATLDGTRLSQFLDQARVFSGGRRPYPVSIHYLGGGNSLRDLPGEVARGVRRALSEQRGDILVFLPGSGEIHRAAALMETELAETGLLIRPLYGDMSLAEQAAAILPDPGGRRRVVLATSIAETSLTIEGIGAVVDSGWSRRARFDPGSGMTRLHSLRSSRSTSEQRSGRAGRLGPGLCYRLWSQAEQEKRPERDPPEMLEADLAPLALELALWGVSTPDGMIWQDPPPAGAYAQARQLLTQLGAIDDQGRVTELGRQMAGLPLHPRLAYMLLAAQAAGQLQDGCDLAALLSERDLLLPEARRLEGADLEIRRRLFQAWRADRGRGGGPQGTDPARLRTGLTLSRTFGALLAGGARKAKGVPYSLGGLVALAYPERIAKRRGAREAGFLASSGRALRLEAGDPLGGEEYLAVAGVDAGVSEGRILLAATLAEAELRRVAGARIRRETSLGWDSRSETVAAREAERLGALVLQERRLEVTDGSEVRHLLCEQIRRAGLTWLPWNEEIDQWRQRVLSLRAWDPEGQWPDVSDQGLLLSLEQWLEPQLWGCRGRRDLQGVDLAAGLASRLDPVQRQRLDVLAPTHLPMPSGSRRRLEYEANAAPILAVRLQEVFGLAETPRVCGGRIPLVLHLLSPAQRPIQVTQDLAGFWNRTYAEVKKELKGRYPKHFWPDDPWNAPPTATVRPRKPGSAS